MQDDSTDEQSKTATEQRTKANTENRENLHTRLVEASARFLKSIHNYQENGYVRPASIEPYYRQNSAGSAS